MRRNVIILFVFCFSFNLSYPYSIIVELDSALKNAAIIDTFIVKEYNYEIFYGQNNTCCHYGDTIVNLIFLEYLNYPESIIKTYPEQCAIRKIKIGQEFIFEGWPNIGDTLVFVIDIYGRIVLFAEILKEYYKFWIPYWSGSLNLFYVSPPVIKSSYDGKPDYMTKLLDAKAKEWGYSFASEYYCLVPKNYLTKFNKKSSP